MEAISIQGEVRESIGRKNAAALRRAEQVPCVMYGGSEVTHFSTSALALSKLIYTPNFHTVDVQIGGKSTPAILKEVQFHPVTERILHCDLIELTDGKKVIVDLPVRFTGQSVGVKAGGSLLPQMRKIRVKAFPKDIIAELVVDITELDLGKSIKVGELNFDNLEIMNNPGIPIASVEIPRALKSAQGKDDGAAAGPVVEEAE